MIAKRINIKPGNDNYTRLAEYIQAADHDGEKSLMAWCAGCLGGDDYAEGIAEAVDVQAMNVRTTKEKTYHLVISFRHEDEARLTPEAFKVMEERFAAALGYSEHQRHCGVHKNTGNLHMHMAYNMINPEKRTRHEPFRDFYKLSRVCRELEQEYGLTVDRGITPGIEPTRPNQKAALVEAHTGQQSFASYAGEHREAIVRSLEKAVSWRDVHTTLAGFGMEVKPHGNGMVIKDRHDKQAIKASSLDRTLSRGKLEARFGAYEPPQGLEHIQEHSRYEAAPLHRSPERGALYAEYRQGIAERKARLEDVKQQEMLALAAIRERWAIKRQELERMSIDKRKRRGLLQLSRKYEIEELAKAKVQFQEPREAVRRETPYTSWNAFLQHKSEQGNELALAVLRSIKDTAEVEREIPVAPQKDWSQHGREQFNGWNAAVRAEHATKERAVLENTSLTRKSKTALLAVLRMEQIAGEDVAEVAGFSYSIDRRGIVLFTLPGGGMIKDTGKELFFSPHDTAAVEIAVQYAQKKWGKELLIEENRLCRKDTREQKRGMER
jgi:Relaxase/Mobilisation nuclease domain.